MQVQAGVCGICGRRRLDYLGDCEVEHLEPLEKGGYDGVGNVYVACSTCNRVKGDGSRAEAQNRLEEAGCPMNRTSAARALEEGLRAARKIPESWLKKTEED